MGSAHTCSSRPGPQSGTCGPAAHLRRGPAAPDRQQRRALAVSACAEHLDADSLARTGPNNIYGPQTFQENGRWAIAVVQEASLT